MPIAPFVRSCVGGWLLLVAAVSSAAPPSAWDSFTPDSASVVRYGPAYRYPQSGWTVLHIEGAPYERGYQHGRLMAREIAELIVDMARERSATSPTDAWKLVRHT